MATCTPPSGSVSMLLTIPSSVIGRRSSGSITLPNAVRMAVLRSACESGDINAECKRPRRAGLAATRCARLRRACDRRRAGLAATRCARLRRACDRRRAGQPAGVGEVWLRPCVLAVVGGGPAGLGGGAAWAGPAGAPAGGGPPGPPASGSGGGAPKGGGGAPKGGGGGPDGGGGAPKGAEGAPKGGGAAGGAALGGGAPNPCGSPGGGGVCEPMQITVQPGC